MLDFFLDILFPPVCGICQRIDKNWICPKCKNNLKNEIIFGVDNYSQDSTKMFNEHLYIFKYGGIIRSAILNYKFNEKSYIYKTFITIILQNQNFIEIIKTYDIIVPVPLGPKRKKQRGYNQSGLIARELSKKLKIKYNPNLLEKRKNTVPQSSLSKEERELNIRNAYILHNNSGLKGKRVLLIDDIYTTGSTVNECSKIIMTAGALDIGVLTIAKD